MQSSPTNPEQLHPFPFKVARSDDAYLIEPIHQGEQLQSFACPKFDVDAVLRGETVFQLSDGGGFLMMKVWRGQVSTICALPSKGYRINHVATVEEWITALQS